MENRHLNKDQIKIKFSTCRPDKWDSFQTIQKMVSRQIMCVQVVSQDHFYYIYLVDVDLMLMCLSSGVDASG